MIDNMAPLESRPNGTSTPSSSCLVALPDRNNCQSRTLLREKLASAVIGIGRLAESTRQILNVSRYPLAESDCWPASASWQVSPLPDGVAVTEAARQQSMLRNISGLQLRLRAEPANRRSAAHSTYLDRPSRTSWLSAPKEEV